MSYKFIDDKGTFIFKNPQQIAYLYFPLTNREGTILSCISPSLAGDIKRDNETFLTPPATIEDIQHSLFYRREFFLKLLYPHQDIIRLSLPAESILEAGLLYHKIKKIYKLFTAEIINFVPYDLNVEVMWIKIKNIKNNLRFIPTFFLPLYGRGEKNLRDHRHVSSLLNRIELLKYGIILKPTMIFDEKGHRINKTSYFVLGYKDRKQPPIGQFPNLLAFCGEKGNLLYPEAVFGKINPGKKKKPEFDGKEVCASFRFSEEKLKGKVNYIIIMGITDNEKEIKETFVKLDSLDKVNDYLNRTKLYWQNLTDKLHFDFKNKNYNNWLKWVILQPTLRKLFGCSFLPHFDYGKGGRGWRDLWQDALNLLIIEPDKTKKLIIHNFEGVRIDGSNATIITKEGNFIPDRNRITRVWMDHGIWPYLTLKEYLHYTKDIDILLKETTYFRDAQLKRAKELDNSWEEKEPILKTKNNEIYRGSILEHILVENLVQFFNVGEHNFIKLENGDWNDGLDMGSWRGESVTFSCMYAYNLKDICSILETLKNKRETVELFQELTLLLDRLTKPINYDNYKEKQAILEEYLEKTKHTIKGKKEKIKISDLIRDLREKSFWLTNHIRKNAWLKSNFFNGYYDNKGRRVEGKIKGKVRMMLPSQVFAIMSGIVTKKNINKIWQSIKKYLKDPKLNGFRLNTDFEDIYMDLGRAFGFVYGDKENGAFFNHMVVMLAYALYSQGFIKEGKEVLSSIYNMATSLKAKIYPMIPEYFNSQGRGLYFYLTGSASWYTHTLLKQVLGVNWQWGDLIIEPKLTKDDFFSNTITVEFNFLKRRFKLNYIKEKEANIFKIKYAYYNDKKILPSHGKILLPRKDIEKYPFDTLQNLNIYLKD
ncbi:MAG: cellobiose phosphorylase [Candidatus Omnitrophica bacterium]|nr:cellobiose phosphorylase [Candidatus Omnitrophota bacterium]